MKIAYLIKKLEYGGAEKQLMSVAQEQRRQGHEVLIITLQEPYRIFHDEMTNAGIAVHENRLESAFHLPRTAFSIYRDLLNFQPDVIHSHMFHANIVARLLYPFIRTPIFVSTAHNIKEGGKLRDKLYRLTDPFCDVTTNVSKAAVQRYNADGLVRNNACQLIENGIYTKDFVADSASRERYRNSMGHNNKFVWLSVASLTKQKDFPNMLHAFKEASSRMPSTHLLIAGDGPEKHAITQLIKSLGISDRVTLLGNRDDTCELYSMADGFVMSSAWEGLPIVLLEALSSSLPCVVTDVGGNSDLVINEQCGYVVPPHSSTKLGEAMIRYMSLTEAEKDKYKLFARLHIIRNYDISHIAQAWINLYVATNRQTFVNGSKP